MKRYECLWRDENIITIWDAQLIEVSNLKKSKKSKFIPVCTEKYRDWRLNNCRCCYVAPFCHDKVCCNASIAAELNKYSDKSGRIYSLNMRINFRSCCEIINLSDDITCSIAIWPASLAHARGSLKELRFIFHRLSRYKRRSLFSNFAPQIYAMTPYGLRCSGQVDKDP